VDSPSLPDGDRESPESSPSRKTLSHGLIVLGIVWFALVLAHFLFINPWGRPLWTVVPKHLVRILAEPGPFLGGLGKSLVVTVCHCPHLVVFGIVGWIYVYRRLAHGPLGDRMSLALLMGIVLVGIPLHFLGMFGLLGRWQTLALPLVAGILTFLLPRRSRPENDGEEEHGQPESRLDRWLTITAWCLTWILTALTFYHALAFPVDYWDALIYYVDYAQRTWEHGGFPVAVCGQVGIGLGANYPHLFHVLQVLGAHIAGSWSDLYGQMLPPVFGVVTIGLLAGLLRNLFRSRLVVALGVLGFRAIPYGFTYQVWVSDYSLAIVLTAGFFYCLERFLRRGEWRWFEAGALFCAAMPYVNYLGWIYFPLLAAAPLLLTGRKDDRRVLLQKAAPFLLLAVAVAIPWYVRNVVVTGNPVYAFFYEWLDGKHVDPEVMESCRVEWTANGDGPVQLGPDVLTRLIRTPWYLLIANPSWKLGPLFTGLLIPGFCLAMFRRENRSLFVLMALFGLLMFFYEYVVSGLYLYHALGFLPVYACFASYLPGMAGHRQRRWIASLILLAALCPGLAFSLMGPKFNDVSLRAIRYGSMDRETYYRVRYPQDFAIWNTINEHCEEGAKILTHENRYHLFRRDIELVHLDDWDVSRFYGKPFEEVHEWLCQEGIRYYLKIPNEQNHPITARLGHSAYLKNPDYFQEILRSGGTVLYRIASREPGSF